MSIVITTPTGHVGGRIAEVLVASGAEVVLVVRSMQKVAQWERRGVRIVEGSHGDPKVLIEATKGAQALYLASPPNLQTHDLLAEYGRFAEAAVQAITANKIPYVVHLSSVGADLDRGTGPVVGLYRNEQMLNQTAANVAHLRPAYFMENTLMQLPTVVASGQMFTSFKGETAFPMIATRDIGDRAAKLLSERRWSGSKAMELMGPEDLSYDQVAAMLTGGLGKTVQHTTVPGGALLDNLLKMGASRHIAELFLELSEAIEAKRVRFSGIRDENTRTPTTYREFAEQVFKPAAAAASEGQASH